MSSITTQQTKLDLELVPKENRIDIGKCNGKIPRGLTPREPTFQAVLDAIALTPCYPTFLITTDVPKVYMHQFWNSVYKHYNFYRFKIDKKKRFKLTLEVFIYIFQIFPRVHGREFDPLPSEEDTVSFLSELSIILRNQFTQDCCPDQNASPWRTFAALINRNLSGKTSGLDKLCLSPELKFLWLINYRAILPECLTSPAMKESKAYKTYLGYATYEEPVIKGKRVKRPAKKSTTKPAAGVVIREAPVEIKRSSDERSKKEELKGLSQDTCSGTVVKKLPSVDKITSTVTSEGTGDSRGSDCQKKTSTE
ncbi:hypothetical protein Tco_1167703 [Tanacetum coccineum]